MTDTAVQNTQEGEIVVSKPTKAIGRPKSITEEVVSKLTAALQHGYNITKACQYAKITRETYYQELNRNEDFADKMADAEDYWITFSGDIITQLLTSTDKRDTRLKVETAKWVFEKKMPKEYGLSSAAGGNINLTQNNIYVKESDSSVKGGLDALLFRGKEVYSGKTPETNQD